MGVNLACLQSSYVMISFIHHYARILSLISSLSDHSDVGRSHFMTLTNISGSDLAAHLVVSKFPESVHKGRTVFRRPSSQNFRDDKTQWDKIILVDLLVDTYSSYHYSFMDLAKKINHLWQILADRSTLVAPTSVTVLIQLHLHNAQPSISVTGIRRATSNWSRAVWGNGNRTFVMCYSLRSSRYWEKSSCQSRRSWNICHPLRYCRIWVHPETAQRWSQTCLRDVTCGGETPTKYHLCKWNRRGKQIGEQSSWRCYCSRGIIFCSLTTLNLKGNVKCNRTCWNFKVY